MFQAIGESPGRQPFAPATYRVPFPFCEQALTVPPPALYATPPAKSAPAETSARVRAITTGRRTLCMARSSGVRAGASIPPIRYPDRAPGLRLLGAGIRHLRARLGRAADHRAPRPRPLGRARLLDRSRLAGRARLEGRRHALHRAPALQGHALVLGPGDRRDLRRDGRRAERGHVARVDGRVRTRPRPSSRARPRRDGGHGLRADVRRRRRRAGGRARGDRDGGGHAAGSRPRPPGRGRLRQPRARPAGDRARGRDLVRQPAHARPRTTGRRTARATSSSRRPATSSTIICCRCSSAPLTSVSSRRRPARPCASRS